MQSVLQNFADRYSGVSSNRVRLEVQGAKDGLGPGTTISFTLPSAAIVNLRTIALNGIFNGVGVGCKVGSLASLFERVECSIGGQCISPGNYWGVAHSIHQAHSGCRGSLIHDHPIAAPKSGASYMRGHKVADTEAEEFPFQFSDWTHGFLASAPAYFNWQTWQSSKCYRK